MNERWRIEDRAIVWDVANDTRLPHEDHVEMSGRQISVIVRYRIDENRRLHLTREVIWPMLRLKEGDVRGYLRRSYVGLTRSPIFINGKVWEPQTVSQIRFDGTLVIQFDTFDGIDCVAGISPDGNRSETWLALRGGDGSLSFGIGDPERRVTEQAETATGVYGTYHISTMTGYESPDNSNLNMVGEWIAAYSEQQAAVRPAALRNRWISGLQQQLILETPDTAINAAFSFAKLRAAESLFETRMGLVHSPGGGRYYGGVWNNDQCEYSGPFFGYLGDDDARTAALTAYRNFVPFMTSDYTAIPTSLEMEGTIPFRAGGDRGDAAMYASGASRFALSVGDLTLAEELYHPITWCLEYCRRQRNPAGVVASDCDELENRFPAGDANLCTSSLYYDGLRRTADLARDLSRHEDAIEYDLQAVRLAEAMEKHFGAKVEGFETYRYYNGNTTLRAWICLPLAFGVGTDVPEAEYIPSVTMNPDRRSGTLDALFSPRLWQPDGLATESGKPDFWDRSTLYALRAAFFAGDTERALEHLAAYTRRRLLGDHVPYPVEAYPEGGQAHLSAESALYCRAIVEGMFGLVPGGLRRFHLTPRLPAAWNEMALRAVSAFGHRFDIIVTRTEETLSVRVTTGETTLFETSTPAGDRVTITLPE